MSGGKEANGKERCGGEEEATSRENVWAEPRRSRSEEDDTLTRLEEIVSLCRDSRRRTLRRTLAAGNKLPLEISESLLPRSCAGLAPRSSSREEQFYCISKPALRELRCRMDRKGRVQRRSPPGRRFERAGDMSLRPRERRKGGANAIVALAADDACLRKQTGKIARNGPGTVVNPLGPALLRPASK